MCSYGAKTQHQFVLLDRTKQSCNPPLQGARRGLGVESGAVPGDFSCAVGASAVRDRRDQVNIWPRKARRLWPKNPDCS